ncbi:hypothetical protein [Silicimonas algicola]|uniref:Putative flap endonuclease-1-like 5' DNA nuclease n=1 Tax=Silicimonas algicola TaxID=1826607 RepID=A0A316G933_9RHOB|nr:hypothetical protein [Silicimonas algicola]PWK57489.1 putative flap endonuclease-1-like 5' DNA nuclease [Silicimonas algicola]
MSGHEKASNSVVWGAGIGLFLVSFIVLFWPGDYGFIAAFFIALLIALLSTVVIWLWFHGMPALGNTAAPEGTVAPEPASAPKPSPGPEGVVAHTEPADEPASVETASSPSGAAASPDPKPAPVPPPDPAPIPDPDPAPMPDPDPAPVPDPAPAAIEPEPAAHETSEAMADTAGPGERPSGLDAPRGGEADDLKRIKGVGPKLEKLLNSLGFWHFEQIGNWSASEIAWVDHNLEGFKGRVTRDKWVSQARMLADGGETDFSKRVDKGGVY